MFRVGNKNENKIQDKCENNNCYDLFDCFQEGVYIFEIKTKNYIEEITND